MASRSPTSASGSRSRSQGENSGLFHAPYVTPEGTHGRVSVPCGDGLATRELGRRGQAVVLAGIPVVVKDACGFGHRDAAARSIASLEFAGDALLTNADTFCAQFGRIVPQTA